MTNRTDTATAPRAANQAGSRSYGYAIYQALIGLAALGVLLQGLWAGIFLEGQHRSDKWVNVHARGAEVTIGVTIVALLAALVWLRRRRDLVIGTAVLVVALVVEAYLGGRITDDGNDTLTAVHVPLAMAVMGLAVWLPLRARTGKKGTARL
jgi:membrane-associated PAP2 superfamily phosphatase